MKVCEQHGEYESMVRELPDRVLESNCPTCIQERQEQEWREERARYEQDRQARIMKNLFQQTAIPERFVGRTFKNYRVDPQNKAQVWWSSNFRHPDGLFCRL